MQITAKIIEDSITKQGKRLTTFQLLYPRFIHGELMTHRVFSRNASSSRAIPVERLVQMALDDPAFFVHVGKNIPGMQANEEVSKDTKDKFFQEWCELAHIAAEYARRWAGKEKDGGYNIHKQCVNRVMEPWHHIGVVLTTSELDNWNALRDHPKAQPEIQVLAAAMDAALAGSIPRLLKPGEWHLPYVREAERKAYKDDPKKLCALSTARCARVSFLNHDGSYPDEFKDLKLHDDLVGAQPKHMSPTEHQAMAAGWLWRIWPRWRRSNFNSAFVQYRKFIEHDRFLPNESPYLA